MNAYAIAHDPLGELQPQWLKLFQELAHNKEWQLIFAIVFHRIELVTESGAIRDRVLEGHTRALTKMNHFLSLAVDHGQLPAGRGSGSFLSGRGCGDRKSTRLNSSHVAISYAVFCLKKKKRT